MLGVLLRFPCWWSLAWFLKDVVNTELEGLHVAHGMEGGNLLGQDGLQPGWAGTEKEKRYFQLSWEGRY